MRYNRRKALTILGAATAATVLPGTARAGTNPTINAVSPAPSRETGRIGVWASSTVAMTGAKARILTARGGSLITEVTDVSFVPSDGRWESTEPLLLDELGVFWIEWEVYSQDGGVGKGEQYLHYWRIPAITDFSVSPTVLNSRNHTVTFVGHATYRHPGTLAVAPLAHFPMSIGYGHAGDPEFITDENGRFAGSIDIFEYRTEIAVHVGPGPGRHIWHTYASQEVQVQVTETRLSLSCSHVSVLPGQPVTVAGKLEQHLDGAWVPLAGRTIDIWLEGSVGNGGPGVRATTDATGSYSTPFTPSVPGHIHAMFPDTSDDFYYTAARAEPVVVHLLRTVVFSDTFRVVRISAPGAPIKWAATGQISETRLVEIQFSHDGKANWTTLATTWSRWDGFYGESFYAEFTVHRDGYIRAYTAATDSTLTASSRLIWLPPPGNPRVENSPGPERPSVPRL